MTRIYNENMPKSMYDMDEQELGALIEKLSETVERLAHERPGSGEYNHWKREVTLVSGNVRQLS
jgi:hypothetical protein